MTRNEEYKVSDRVTLKRGDYFRAKGGPYYISKEKGKNISMKTRGPYMFLAYCEKNGQHWIEAYSISEGTMTILSLDEDRPSIMPGSYVMRPYEILGGVSAKKQQRLERKQGGKTGRKIAMPKQQKKGRSTASLQNSTNTQNAHHSDPQVRLGGKSSDAAMAAWDLVNSVLAGVKK